MSGSGEISTAPGQGGETDGEGAAGDTAVTPGPDRAVRYGRFTLIRRIGKGGMAEVFLATMEGARGVRRKCVVKRILPEKARSPYFAQMFVDEARITSALHHPNIIHIYEFGEIGQLYFLAMEHLDGKNLASVLGALKAREHRMSVPMAAFIAGQIARGLHYAHTLADADGRPLGVIHRDVSPSNVMLMRTGEVKILDFGVAKAERVLKEGATVVGKIKGKLSYMAPEQLSAREVDFRADIFSLGCVLWEMLTGEPLFSGHDGGTRSRRLFRGQVPLPSHIRPGLPTQVDGIVLRCLQHSPDARYTSAAALAEELAAVAREARFDPDDLVRMVGDLTGSQAQEETVLVSGVDSASAEPASDASSTVAEGAPVPSRGTGSTKLERPPRWSTQPVPVPLARPRRLGWGLVIATVIGAAAAALVLLSLLQAEHGDSFLSLPPATRSELLEPAPSKPAAVPLPPRPAPPPPKVVEDTPPEPPAPAPVAAPTRPAVSPSRLSIVPSRAAHASPEKPTRKEPVTPALSGRRLARKDDEPRGRPESTREAHARPARSEPRRSEDKVVDPFN
jgi:serine/threonine-protein kinase